MSREHAELCIVRDYLLEEMPFAIERGSWDSQRTLFGMSCAIRDPDIKAYLLNRFLLMPGHVFHEEVAQEIRELASPSSVPFIRQMLEDGFDMLDYTSAKPAVIARWFSEALGAIGTPEALALMREFSNTRDRDIASEMRRRLRRLGN